MSDSLVPAPLHRDIAAGTSGLLAQFNTAGEISPADVHVATKIADLAGEHNDTVRLAAALTVRAVRGGSICIDLETLPTGSADPRTGDWDAPADLWPEVDWAGELAQSPLVAGGPSAPLHLSGGRLYLTRYWQEETQVLTDLLARTGPAGEAADEAADEAAEEALAASLQEYFPDPAFADQKAAAGLVARSLTAVITGGPGTGKTTTVARLLGVLFDTDPAVRVALAAPTGKAAARMAEALADAAEHATFPAPHRQRITGIPAMTIHRLLGARRGDSFRHTRANPLPYDVVIIDETSMVPLTLMARLLDALRPASRLVLVGDADQLSSVEAGAVLGDLVEGLRSFDPYPVAELTRSRRFGAGIAAVAESVRAGDGPGAVQLLFESEGEAAGAMAEEDLRGALLATVRAMHEAASAGDAPAALELSEQVRVLCAHREGRYGVSEWNRRITGWLAADLGTQLGRWFPGKPFLITRNDYALRLYNGDTGVVVRRDGQLVAALSEGGRVREFALARLSDITEAYAMTVHRSQGSQFRDVYVVLPEVSSKILTRELLYTAITRAQERVRVIGQPEVVEAAVTRHAGRASGLATRLRAASVPGGVELIDHAPG